MPTYNFLCHNGSGHQFEQYLSFAEFDGCKGQLKCPTCGAPSRVVILEDVHGHLVNRNTVGFQAEENTRKLGKYGHEEALIADAKKRKPIKKRKTPWYGQLDKPKANKILNEKDDKKRQEKITKYVNTGEI